MITPALAALSEIATDAHTRIQKNCADINPVVGVSRGMRKQGIPADAMTIDCLKTRRRIILILHDQQPGIVRYQFALKDDDPADDFEIIPLIELNTDKLYEWIKTYFSKD